MNGRRGRWLLSSIRFDSGWSEQIRATYVSSLFLFFLHSSSSDGYRRWRCYDFVDDGTRHTKRSLSRQHHVRMMDATDNEL